MSDWYSLNSRFCSTFAKWEPNGDEIYGSMKFEKGVHCWNGPDRSAAVSRCLI